MSDTKPATKRRRTKTIDSVLAHRERTLNSFYKLAPASQSLAIDFPQLEKPSVDTARMTARALISTPAVDRVGDVLNPMGCVTRNYALNPVVLWAHGFSNGFDIPLGKSEDENGQLTVEMTEGGVYATCHFSKSLAESEQIFQLIDEGIVRATSVREAPLESYWSGENLHVDSWDLEEWSWCAVGVNPECVAKALDVLSKNRLAGRVIAPSIAKSLLLIVPEQKRHGIGFEEIPVVKTKPTAAQLKSMSPDELAKAKADMPEVAAEVDDEIKRRKAELDAMIPESAASTPAETVESEMESSDEIPSMEDVPYGQTVLASHFNGMRDLIDGCMAALGKLENPTVKEGLTEILAALNAQQDALVGLYSSAYPDAPALKADVPEGETEAGAMKAFLAKSQNNQYQIQGIIARVNGVAKSVDAKNRSVLTNATAQLSRLATAAKSMKSAPKVEPKPETDSAEIESLNQRLNELLAKVQK